MRTAAGIAYLVLTVFLVLLMIRFVLNIVVMFAREWRPKGVVLVIVEGVFTITDPPLVLVRKLIRPVRIGNFRLDLAYMIVVLLCIVLMRVLQIWM